MTTDSVITLDPNTFAVTNRFLYSNIGKLGPEEKSDQFTFEADKTVFQFKTAHRSQLLCQLFECIVKKLPAKYKSVGPFNAERQHKRGSKLECRLAVAPYGIVEMSPAGVVVQEYKFVNVTEIAVDDACKGVFIRYGGRRKVFIVPDMMQFIAGCKTQLKQIGIESVKFVNLVIKDVVASRITDYNATGTAVAIFDVNKSTRRFARMMPRQIHLTEEFVIEKDSSGFQYVSYHPVSSIYALVRSWTNPREFTIEYNNGTSRTFTCAVRDTLLAVLYDICIATGNIRVIVTGEVSDGLRLMPRFAEEDYQASLTDAFFGASSIETWFLSRLSKACKMQISTAADEAAIELACKELNANVPCPGIGATSDITIVKNVIRGVLIVLFNYLDRMIKSPLADHARSMAVLLQTIYRLLPSVAGYKGFVETREVDTRMLLLQLIQIDNDFVNYWALQVLTTLCKCPLTPRNQQQEFVNKHTLLSDQMINCLVELMSTRIDAPEEAGTEEQPAQTPGDEQGDDEVPAEESENTPKVAPNPEAHAHLAGLVKSAAPAGSTNRLSVRRRDVNDDTLRSEEISFPNSLVIVGAAGLLESVLSSQRDTSSPELLHKVLDALASHYEVLVHMLRSNSLLILETAAILMFVLQKNRPKITYPLREMALSECLVLKNFHSAVFSPSGNQRFISRFLVATWMSGNDKLNPAKALLLRLVPPGLIEFLKHQTITDEQRKNLDAIEEEFYKTFGGASKYTVQSLFADIYHFMQLIDDSSIFMLYTE